MKEFEKTGKLMPCNIASQFLIKSMMDKGWNNNIFLIDGFIKAKAGFFCWINDFSKLVDTKFVLYLECSEKEMLNRLKKRSIDSNRLDDIENLFQIRINTFKNFYFN